MPVCPKCGVEVAADVKACPACGAALAEAPATEEKKFSADSVKKLSETKDFTAEMDAEDIEKNKILALFSYIGILFLIPLLACKDSKFARFHANQGIVFCIFSIALNLILGILGGIVGVVVGVCMALGETGVIIGGIVGAILGLVTGLLGLVVSVVCLVLCILGIVNAVSGKAKELPVIGKYRILK